MTKVTTTAGLKALSQVAEPLSGAGLARSACAACGPWASLSVGDFVEFDNGVTTLAMAQILSSGIVKVLIDWRGVTMPNELFPAQCSIMVIDDIMATPHKIPEEEALRRLLAG